MNLYNTAYKADYKMGKTQISLEIDNDNEVYTLNGESYDLYYASRDYLSLEKKKKSFEIVIGERFDTEYILDDIAGGFYEVTNLEEMTKSCKREDVNALLTVAKGKKSQAYCITLEKL